MSGISCGIFNDLYLRLAEKIAPKTLLDIGAGQGKYADLTRQAGVQARMTATEIVPDYVERFGLREKYDEVLIMDAAQMVIDSSCRNRLYDVVTIGDCIEHIPKSQALDLLNFLAYRSAYTIVIAPEFLYYDVSGMEHSEAHISVWSEYDFQWHDRWAFMRSEFMQIFILRGYQPHPVSLEELVGNINTKPVSVHKQDGSVHKAAHLELRVRARAELVDGVPYTFRNA
jgi:hypothetical protein